MRLPEMHSQHDFDTLLETEIARIQDTSAVEPPKEKDPLSIDEFKDLAADQMKMPTDEQLENFFHAFENDRDIMQYSKPGYRIVPVLMPHDHGFPSFEPDRLEKFGHLYYYVLNKDNLTLRASDLAYMDAVLPPEIIANGVVLPEDFREPAKMIQIYGQFEESVNRMLKLVR